MKPAIETETLDRLFLELSQFTKATTKRELALQASIYAARRAVLEICWQLEKCGASEELTKASALASALEAELNVWLPI